jgi:helix-turn-helix, Psq domain
LEEALKVVRKGEMTVHRAGHFFGIPHSTLEYKIKEGNTVSKCSTTDTDIVMEDKQPSSSSSSLDMPDSAFSQSEAQKKLDKKTSTAPIMDIATQMAFNWPRDNMMAGMNFGLAPLFFGSPFSDLFTGFRGAQTAAFLADSAAQEKMLPFYALHHQGKSAFTSPFRPWAPSEKKDKSGQASQKDQGCAQMIPEEDEPLDLIKKEVSVKVTD